MHIKRLKNKVSEIEKFLSNIDESSIDTFLNNFLKNEHKLEMLMPDLNYDYLCNTHLEIYQLLEKLLNGSDYDINDNINKQTTKTLLILKIKVDRLILNHPQYNKSKFKNNFESNISIHRSRNEFLVYLGKFKKKYFLDDLSGILVSNSRIENDYKKEFKRLFYKLKKLKPKSKIVWKYELVDLRAFFDVLSELELVKLPHKSDVFIEENFLDKNKLPIDKKYYSNLASRKIDYQEQHNYWNDVLMKMK